jgi:hypothetical protein
MSLGLHGWDIHAFDLVRRCQMTNRAALRGDATLIENGLRPLANERCIRIVWAPA